MHYLRRKVGKPFTDALKTTTETIETAYQSALYSETDKCVIWPLRRNKGGYAVWARDGHFSAIVARHMCREIHGEPPTSKHQTAHICGRGHFGCVNPRHLVWKTATGNAHDRYQHGTILLGTDNWWVVKLDPEKVRRIRVLLRDGLSNAAIGEEFGVCAATVWAIKTGRTWRHVT